MSRITVERLALQVPGLSPEAGRQLAAAVAEALAASAPSLAAGLRGSIRVQLDAEAGEDRDALARRIVAAVLASAAGEGA